MYSLAATTQVSIVVVFLGFLITGYLNGISAKFLAPVGTKDAFCNAVLKPVPTNTYLADYNGYWSGQVGYSSFLSKYKFIFNNLYLSNDAYTSAISEVYTYYILPDLINRASSRNLAQNMIQWMSWRV